MTTHQLFLEVVLKRRRLGTTPNETAKGTQLLYGTELTYLMCGGVQKLRHGLVRLSSVAYSRLESSFLVQYEEVARFRYVSRRLSRLLASELRFHAHIPGYHKALGVAYARGGKAGSHGNNWLIQLIKGQMMGKAETPSSPAIDAYGGAATISRLMGIDSHIFVFTFKSLPSRTLT